MVNHEHEVFRIVVRATKGTLPAIARNARVCRASIAACIRRRAGVRIGVVVRLASIGRHLSGIGRAVARHGAVAAVCAAVGTAGAGHH